MKKLILLPAIALVLSPFAVHAQFTDVLDSTATEVYGSTSADAGDLTYIIGTVINIIISILGVILLVLLIYSGYLWMTAGGNSDQVEKAKKFMINAVIGLIITLAAYAITNFVINALVTANLAS